MIEARNISYQLKGNTILHPMSLNFELNKISLLLGSNGAGKSSLIKLLSGQEKTSTGEIIIQGRNLSSINNNMRARFQGVLSQQTNVSFPLSVNEIVTMGRSPHFKEKPTNRDVQVVEEAMRFLDISDFKERDYFSLSGGEKQRVHFARVLAQIWPEEESIHPKVLYLDEPLTFLDVYYQLEFIQLIRSFMKRQAMYVIGVVHDLNLAYKFADDITFLKGGKVLVSGSKEDVFTPQYVKACFGVDLHSAKGEQDEKVFYI